MRKEGGGRGVLDLEFILRNISIDFHRVFLFFSPPLANGNIIDVKLGSHSPTPSTHFTGNTFFGNPLSSSPRLPLLSLSPTMPPRERPENITPPDAKRKKVGKAKHALSVESREEAAQNKLLIAALRQGDCNEMLRIFQAWKADTTIPLKEQVVGMVLSGVEKHCTDLTNRWDDVLDLYATLTTRCNLDAPKENHTSLMIRLCATAGKTQEAMAFLKQLDKTAAVSPQKVTKSRERSGPRMRSVMPILNACSRVGDYETAEKVFLAEIAPMHGKGPMTEMESVQWQDCAFARLGAVAANSTLTVEEKRLKSSEIMTALFDIVPSLKVFGQANAAGATYERAAKKDILNHLGSIGYTPIDSVEISSEGVCSVTGVSLRARTLSRNDLEELKSLIELLCLETATEKQRSEWAEFRVWLQRAVERKAVFRHIIDGANVGHALQNNADGCFSHQQIDAVATASSDPLIVIREHWLRPTTNLIIYKTKAKKPSLRQIQRENHQDFDPEATLRNRDNSIEAQLLAQQQEMECEAEEEGEEEEETPVERCDRPPTAAEQYRKKWESEGCLLVAPHRVCDDWVAMYIACEMMLLGVPDVQLVTNDIFRDHYWRMHQHEALPVWIERNLTKFVLSMTPQPKDVFTPNYSKDEPRPQYRSARLVPPKPFSVKGQVSDDGKIWHIPFETEPITWAACRLE